MGDHGHLDQTNFDAVTAIAWIVGEEQDLIRSYELGVNAFVVKPVDFNAFFEAIQDLGMFWGVLNETPPRVAASNGSER